MFHLNRQPLSVTFSLLIRVLMDGDVESNPGPTTYNIVKIVKASFHQGNLMFGETAGIQCACNALFAICYTKIKSMGCWKSCDLDFILIKGDEIYKATGLKRYLDPAYIKCKYNYKVYPASDL